MSAYGTIAPSIAVAHVRLVWYGESRVSGRSLSPLKERRKSAVSALDKSMVSPPCGEMPLGGDAEARGSHGWQVGWLPCWGFAWRKEQPAALTQWWNARCLAVDCPTWALQKNVERR